MMPDAVELVKRLYEWFNTREIDRLLASMHEDVIWANGMEGGHLHGRDEVRRYWTRQWATIDPKVEPVDFSIGSDGEVVVEVHQVVRDLGGSLLVDAQAGHIFRIEDGLVERFDIRDTKQAGQ